MHSSSFTTIRTARTAVEADMMLAALRAAGMHPLELSTSSHFSVAGADVSFPIDVPVSEAEAAREILAAYGNATS
jgi:hypothetical protein